MDQAQFLDRIPMLDIPLLKEIRERVDMEIARKQTTKIEEYKRRVAEMAAELDLEPKALLPTAEKRTKRSGHYRHPDPEETKIWKQKGPTPKWLQNYAGDREELFVPSEPTQ
ncbi:H-NS family nucleoid-associated regulatory protein [Prosthecomicrobium sp. N25]|uniref:H-NS family nucleoid-associated regulatory protein n=1 Tax=Prosthecomicrobium sp. N25 TaxID=3129254 RepID=UPI003077E79E